MGLDADVSITDIPEKYQLILCQQAVIKLIKEAVFAAFGTETVEIDVCFDGSNEIAGVNSQFSNSQTVIQRQKILLCDIFGTETNRQSFDCTTHLHIGESVCQIQVCHPRTHAGGGFQPAVQRQMLHGVSNWGAAKIKSACQIPDRDGLTGLQFSVNDRAADCLIGGFFLGCGIAHIDFFS